MRKGMLLVMALVMGGCKSPGERWFDSLVRYNQYTNDTLQLQMIKMDGKKDTTMLNYQIRIYPAKAFVAAHGIDATALTFRMDSCFFIAAGRTRSRAVFVQPIANGIKDCFEYLVSFPVGPSIKMKALQMVYVDKYLDGGIYKLSLNEQEK